MIQGRYTRIDFREIQKERKYKPVKIGTQADTKMKFEKIVVSIRIAGEATEGKQKGKTVYQTFQSIDVTDATAAEVHDVIYRALVGAAKQGK